MCLPILRKPEGILRGATASPWVVSVVVSTAGVGLVSLIGGESPVRQVVALWFLFTCPGMALVPLLEIDERVFEWSLIIATSLALAAVVAVTLLYAGVWSPDAGLIILMGVSLVGARLQSTQTQRRASKGS